MIRNAVLRRLNVKTIPTTETMLTDAEIIEFEKLVREEEIYQRREALKDFYNNKNPNYTFLADAYSKQKYVKMLDDNDEEIDVLIDGKRGIVLEGSSRSGKTYSAIDFIVYLGLFEPRPVTINILKETYNSFKTTLFDDFKERLDYYDLPNPFNNQDVHSFKINRSKVNLIGADKTGKDGKFHGAGCDFLYINESLDVAKNIFDQSEMRCRKFWFMDYNPSVTEHYVFKNVVTRSDVGLLRTTFKDNPHVSTPERNKILSYEPWLPGSYTVENNEIWYNSEIVDDKNQPPPHPVNVESGQADEFMWKVYGLGLRGAMKGVIFKKVFWIDEMPSMAYTYGIDFGFTTDPTAIVRYCEDDKNIYYELLWYAPIDNPDEINATLLALGVEKYIPITADSSDKYINHTGSYEMVSALYDMGWEISKVSKTNSVMFWLTSMKRKKIHIVRPKNEVLHQSAKKEVENYRFKEVNGILINQPIDKFNHMHDSARYCHMSHASNYLDVDEN